MCLIDQKKKEEAAEEGAEEGDDVRILLIFPVRWVELCICMCVPALVGTER